MTTVEVDQEVYDMIMADAKYGENFNTMLRKLYAERKEAMRQCNELMMEILKAMTRDTPKRNPSTGFDVPVSGSDHIPI
jgi:hypothetical protein